MTISRRHLIGGGLRFALGCGLGRAAAAASVPAAASPWMQAGRPTALAAQAVLLLSRAAEHGLVPADYGADVLAAAVRNAALQPLDEPAAAALADRLDASLMRYLLHLHQGRIDPRQVHHDFDASRRPPFDPAQVLRQAMAAGSLDAAAAAAVPALPQYAQLRAMLGRYRALVAGPAWLAPLPALAARPTSRGASPAAALAALPAPARAVLVQRLQALGDLPPEPPAPIAPPEDEVLVAALRAFQARHGLAEDGLLGPATRRQLEVPPAQRVRQIELSLERLRWTPLLQAPRMVVVNIPEFRLRAYEVEDGRIVLRHEMRVVVGRAMRHQTPVFDEPMRQVEFGPAWNVPLSIARAELVPRLRADPGYLDREGFELVGPGGVVEHVPTPERLAAVAAGSWRLRQRPGPRNALGAIKFVFPNRDAIYLHHTPATGLFARERRDFSHGCIRVEDPVALAAFVLQGLPGWDAAAIRDAMAGETSRTVALVQPLPVLIAYGTALVKQGRMHFFDDVYGHDRRLDAALRRASTAETGP